MEHERDSAPPMESPVPANVHPILECLLFVAAEPVTPRQVSDVLSVEESAADALKLNVPLHSPMLGHFESSR